MIADFFLQIANAIFAFLFAYYPTIITDLLDLLLGAF
jgi:hypothetical protein